MIATALKVTVLVIIFTLEISLESHVGPHIRVKRAETKNSVTLQERIQLLKLHNYFRKQANASNMNHLTWDKTLEEAAQNWADKCVFEHGPTPMTAGIFDSYGQNLYVNSAKLNVQNVVRSWQSEIFDYSLLLKVLGGCRGSACGHYTQIIWATTYKLGCGITYCSSLGGVSFGKGYIVVCNYGPSGNIRGQVPYVNTGQLCTDCPQDRNQCDDDKLCRKNLDCDNIQCSDEKTLDKDTCECCGAGECWELNQMEEISCSSAGYFLCPSFGFVASTVLIMLK